MGFYFISNKRDGEVVVSGNREGCGPRMYCSGEVCLKGSNIYAFNNIIDIIPYWLVIIAYKPANLLAKEPKTTPTIPIPIVP